MTIETANRLVLLRKENGFSQEDLAERLGISRQAVSKWERAESAPDVDNLILLARLYGISIDSLLSADGEPPSADEFPHGNEAEDFRTETEETSAAPSAWQSEFAQIYKLLGDVYPVLVAFVYLAIGFLFHIWHPTWLMFLSIPIFESLGYAVSRTRIAAKDVSGDAVSETHLSAGNADGGVQAETHLAAQDVGGDATAARE